MKRHFPILILLLLVLLTHCGPSKETTALMKQAKSTFGTLPEKMPGSEKDTPAMVALGEKLYFEKRLSANDTISCNSCHGLEDKKAGVDNLPTSPGAFGKNGDRNSPTVLNAGYHIAQFWDGRAANLVEQAKGPILNPIEMAMPDEAAVLEKLKNIPEYPDRFAKAFPDAADPITYDHVAEAIAAFERTQRTQDRFDDFINGNSHALSQEEQRGLDLFIKVGCPTCHSGPLLGGIMYQKLGARHPYENTDDLGRYNVTKKEADKYVFKVPSLRNIALTAPYFHDGRVQTLEEAVKNMAWLQLGQELGTEETASIVKFLNSLSDKGRM